jgi:Carboxypeptidase regulatory-like domain/TonB dependent receptor-like, beta-barrel
MKSGRVLALLVGAAVALLVPQAAHAQAVYGSIAGTVVDSQGAVVPGATVTLTSVERKTVSTTTSNASGNYAKDRLLPGTYEVKAELQGFKTQIVSSAVVNVDSQTKVDFRLETGDLTESVTVAASEGQLLKTDRADVAVTFGTKEITELPVLDRNFTKFLLLTPGTQEQTWQHAASENPQGSTQTMVNGQTFSGTGWQLDGTDNRDVILGIAVINPTLESVGESKITSQNYDAEFGQAVAGVVSVQTKSGTNEVHGSAFEFAQRDRFQARNPFSQPDVVNPLTGKVLPETKKDQFGGSLGGPIQKDKWFAFADYQGSRDTVGGSQLLTVPTAAARAGDLSAYGVNIYDPLTGDPSQRTQFPGNVIPGDRLSPQAQAILDLIPLPNTQGTADGRNNYVAQGSEAFNADQVNTRVDGRLSDRLNVFGRYSFAKYSLNGPTAFGQGGGHELVSLGGDSNVKNHSLATGFDYTINSTTIVDFRFGWYRYKVDVLPFDYGTTPATDAGIPGLNFDSFSSGLPAGLVGGDNTTAPGDFEFGSGLPINRCNCPLAQDEKQWQVVSNLTKVLGNHTVKFGVDIRRANNLRVPSDAHRSGELTFDSGVTRGPDGGGLGLATFLLGDVTHLRRYVSTSTDAREQQWRQFYYAQDTWRATSKLTLNVGLRADIYNPQTVNEAGNGGWLDASTGQILVGGVGDVNLAGNVKNTINWAPRIGVNYRINEKTVIRAGYGRSYDTGVFGSIFGHSVTQNLPVLSVQDLNAPNNFSSVFNLAQGPPAPVFVQPGADGKFALPNGVFARLLPSTQHVPALDAWNVTLQRQLSNTLSAEIGYVGNHSNRAFIGNGPAAGYNEPTLAGFGTLNSAERRPFFAGPISGAPNGADGPLGPYGGAFGWTQGIDYFCDCGQTDYQSLQAKVTKRFSNGFSMLAHYTYQKAKNNDGSYFFIDPSLNYGLNNFQRTHNFVVSALAELPFGKGKAIASDASGLAQALIGGWQLNANVYVQSGLPFDVSYSGAGADRDVGPNRPDVVGNTDGPKTQDQWFNTAPIGDPGSAFSRPATGTFGNMVRDSLTGPGYWDVDASLFKRFGLGASRNLEFRMEVVNVFNHVNLGNPDNTIGIPGDPRTNAGRISGTAAQNQMRNIQFALRFQF